MQFSVRGTVRSGYDTLDYAISDLAILTDGNTITAFASSGPNGGLASYDLPAQGSAALIDTVHYNPAYSAGIGSDIALIDDG